MPLDRDGAIYLVSRSLEDHEETPLLGMEKHLVPALATSDWSQCVRQLHCPGGRWDGASAATRATTNGGLDDDEAVRQAVVDIIRAMSLENGDIPRFAGTRTAMRQ